MVTAKIRQLNNYASLVELLREQTSITPHTVYCVQKTSHLNFRKLSHFLFDSYNFCIVGNRNEHSTIYM